MQRLYFEDVITKISYFAALIVHQHVHYFVVSCIIGLKQIIDFDGAELIY